MKRILLGILVNLFEWLKKISQNNKYAQFRKTYTISESFKFNGEGILLYGEGRIVINDHSYLGNYSTIQAVKDCEVYIGKYCAISHYVKIYTSSYVTDQSFISMERFTKSGSVKVRNGVWIGANVMINPGVSIGDNAVIGANSVVTKNVEANSIVSGVPAAFIRYKKMDE